MDQSELARIIVKKQKRIEGLEAILIAKNLVKCIEELE